MSSMRENGEKEVGGRVIAVPGGPVRDGIPERPAYWKSPKTSMGQRCSQERERGCSPPKGMGRVPWERLPATTFAQPLRLAADTDHERGFDSAPGAAAAAAGSRS